MSPPSMEIGFGEGVSETDVRRVAGLHATGCDSAFSEGGNGSSSDGSTSAHSILLPSLLLPAVLSPVLSAILQAVLLRPAVLPPLPPSLLSALLTRMLTRSPGGRNAGPEAEAAQQPAKRLLQVQVHSLDLHLLARGEKCPDFLLWDRLAVYRTIPTHAQQLRNQRSLSLQKRSGSSMVASKPIGSAINDLEVGNHFPHLPA